MNLQVASLLYMAHRSMSHTTQLLVFNSL